jgi:membrane protein DedA with SNARE-associated domain
MGGLSDWLWRLFDEHAEWAIFLVLLLEESGIPLPVPGDSVMLLAGVRAQQGRIGAVWAVATMVGATLAGGSVLYWLARCGGRPLLFRYARVLRLDLAQLERAERLLRRHGWLAIVAGRILPGLRIATTLAAGVFGVPYRIFLPALALGSTIYILVFFTLGYLAGPRVLALLDRLHPPLHLLVSLVGLGATLAVLLTIRRRVRVAHAEHTLTERQRLLTALMAGVFAAALTTLSLDLALYVLGAAGVARAGAALFALGEVLGQQLGGRPRLALVLGLSGYVVYQIGWAVVYAHVERWLPKPDWVGGLLFALLPLAGLLLVVLPAVGAGPAGVGLGAGALPLVGETVRHALYGASLSTTYTLLSRVWARPEGAMATSAGG